MVCNHLQTRIFSVFFTLILSVSFLNALNFNKCKEFYDNASKTFNGITAIHIGDGKYLAYSTIPLSNKSLIKKDDVLGLYLFKDSPLKNIFTIRDIHKSIPVVAINSHFMAEGKILQNQQSFSNFAIFNKNIDENSIISDICYQIYGISVGGNNFIDKKYIDIFLQNDNLEYSYIGVFVKNSNDGVVVYNINPLISSRIKIGDIILGINDKSIKDSNHFIDTIALIKPNSNITLTIKRDSKILSLDIRTMRQYTHFGDLSSFLEVMGLMLDKNLVVLDNLGKSYFRPNDRILRVNQINISTIEELNTAIALVAQHNNELSFLINRNGFELFITQDIPAISLEDHL